MPKGVPVWLYGLIVTHKATYSELKYHLTIWDVLDLLEIMYVEQSNRDLAFDDMTRK